MTVAELREKLSTYPDDALVLMVDESGDAVDVDVVSPVHVADDGTGVYAVRDSREALERWVRKNAPTAEINPHAAAVLSRWEDA